MFNRNAKIISLILLLAMATCIFLPGNAKVSKSVEEYYYEAKEEFPEFYSTVVKEPVTDELVISAIEDIVDLLVERDKKKAIEESEFKEAAMEAVLTVVGRDKYNALFKVLVENYSDVYLEYKKTGNISEEFEPLLGILKEIVYDRIYNGEPEETPAPTPTPTPTPTPKASTKPDNGGGGGGGGKNSGMPIVNDNNSDTTVGNKNDTTQPQPETEPVPLRKHSFTDCDSVPWAEDAIAFLSEKGIIKGYDGNLFKPGNSVTRAEFTTMIVKAFRMENNTADARFTDVKAEDWFYKYVAIANGMGIVRGYEDGSFRPNDKITRQDIAVIVYRTSKLLGLTFEAVTADTPFDDQNEIAPYAREAVSAMRSSGIIKGKGDKKFAPLDQATRAEAAQILYMTVKDLI